jgi:hypothetical protein
VEELFADVRAFVLSERRFEGTRCGALARRGIRAGADVASLLRHVARDFQRGAVRPGLANTLLWQVNRVLNSAGYRRALADLEWAEGKNTAARR